MRLFDIKKYERPTMDQVSWSETKESVGIFLSAYKIARERVGLSMLPKLTMSYALTNEENQEVLTNEDLDPYESFRDTFLQLNEYFIMGYSSIMHPYRPEVTDRRRKVFMLRYVYGLSVSSVSERIHYQKNIIVDESKEAMIQFAQSLDLLIMK
ncbi:transcriptional regulator, ArpU family protein [uncultured Enterococcus sp.]|uniref:transcriptional regulator, ArpU family protein n=1 Tax=uncultured Enterococcus sp. TaxID=167972 RepID=UPI002AA7EFE0|nr:transcriptional regulator, ArpU family protein [uncultured Enterococcus sp.]